MTQWLTKSRQRWLVLLLLACSIYGLNHIYKEITMPPPLVYLIPEDYFGPVFVFFGQKDGVDLQPDPLGMAVTVPENGVVKIKASVDDVLPEPSEGHRNLYWVAVAKTGTRRILKVSAKAIQDFEGRWFNIYYDEQGLPHKHQAEFQIGERHPFYYFSEKERDENMIFGHGGCKHQNFTAKDEINDESPSCGKFLVISPNVYLTMPRWLWENTGRQYTSIGEFIEEANRRLLQKKEFYKLP